MLATSQHLFAQVMKRKRLAHHNHEIHVLARDIDNWLPTGIQSLMVGDYDPRHLKRHYFQDDVVDQLHLSDRIFQHVLLKELKSTFPAVMNPHCFHVQGPTGVKRATQRIREVLKAKKPRYVIRADIKSFYRSIPHYKLIQDIQRQYDDPKVQAMLERIIRNPLDTGRGCRNPDSGIALRGPLSQFFSAIYLKPLDEAFNQTEVTYLRYQDDILILCQTKRQFHRSRRRMMNVLQERKLSLSRKKSRMGEITSGFHFLGVDYLGTQPRGNTEVGSVRNAKVQSTEVDHILSTGGG